MRDGLELLNPSLSGELFKTITSYKKSGGVLLSHTLPSAVPSALKGLASGFGM